MKVIGINGSPRKNWNTQQLIVKALEGARELGAQTELIQLYDQEFKGCISCFACKIKNSKTNGLCGYKDALTPILEKAKDADVVIVGSPVYYDYPTAQTRAFLERWMFPLDPYMKNENGQRIRFLNKTIPTGMIYTMNCPEWLLDKINYPTILGSNQNAIARLFGYCETLYSCDTYQYSNYDLYDCNMFDKTKKAIQKETQFPIDLQKAYELGQNLVKKAMEEKDV